MRPGGGPPALRISTSGPPNRAEASRRQLRADFRRGHIVHDPPGIPAGIALQPQGRRFQHVGAPSGDHNAMTRAGEPLGGRIANAGAPRRRVRSGL